MVNLLVEKFFRPQMHISLIQEILLREVIEISENVGLVFKVASTINLIILSVCISLQQNSPFSRLNDDRVHES